MKLFEVGEALGWGLEAGFLSVNGFAKELLGADLSGSWSFVTDPWRAS
jgi:hypothetical protein